MQDTHARNEHMHLGQRKRRGSLNYIGCRGGDRDGLDENGWGISGNGLLNHPSSRHDNRYGFFA